MRRGRICASELRLRGRDSIFRVLARTRFVQKRQWCVVMGRVVWWGVLGEEDIVVVVVVCLVELGSIFF
jgi:hypothetical protein